VTRIAGRQTVIDAIRRELQDVRLPTLARRWRARAIFHAGWHASTKRWRCRRRAASGRKLAALAS